jgi:hypothetical protein
MVYAATMLDKLTFEHENKQAKYTDSLYHFQRLSINKVLFVGGMAVAPTHLHYQIPSPATSDWMAEIEGSSFHELLFPVASNSR